MFARVGELWPSIDFVVHAVAFTDKEALTGRYVNLTPENFSSTTPPIRSSPSSRWRQPFSM